MWHAIRTGSFRKEAGVGHPKVHVDSAEMASATPEKKKAMYLFNCAQRGHGNYLENQPSVAVALLIAGLQYPLTTTGLGAAWLVSRLIYAVGYTRRDKSGGEGREIGSGFFLAQLGLYGLAAWTGIKMVL